MIIACYTVLLAYIASLGWLLYGFKKVPPFDTIDQVAKTRFSIIVPFRNEAKNLPNLLNSIVNLDYPNHLFEVILVDDASEFQFQPDQFPFKVTVIDSLRSSNSPKKDAITTAISGASNDWIITTDADCHLPKNWLAITDNYIQQKHPEMIAGAVTYSGNRTFLHHFQQIELASLQVTTIGSFGIGHPFMCNGANFAYKKSFFHDLDGFSGNDSIASGDDVFLLQKAVAQNPEKVHYIKSSHNIIQTKPENSWRSLFYQRVRWASKSGSYHGYFGKFLGLIVFLGNLVVVVLFFAMLFGNLTIRHFFICILLKSGSDFAMAFRNNAFARTTAFFIPASFLYPFFSVSVALYSVFGSYEWKGRTFRK